MAFSERPLSIETLVKEEDWLYFTLLSMVKDPGNAMDIAQETIARALSSKPVISGPGAARKWLIRVAKNIWIDM